MPSSLAGSLGIWTKRDAVGARPAIELPGGDQLRSLQPSPVATRPRPLRIFGNGDQQAGDRRRRTPPSATAAPGPSTSGPRRSTRAAAHGDGRGRTTRSRHTRRPLAGLLRELRERERRLAGRRRDRHDLVINGEPAAATVVHHAAAGSGRSECRASWPRHCACTRTDRTAAAVSRRTSDGTARPRRRWPGRATSRLMNQTGIGALPSARLWRSAPFVTHGSLRSAPASRASASRRLSWSARSINRCMVSAVTGVPLHRWKWRLSRMVRSASSSASTVASAAADGVRRLQERGTHPFTDRLFAGERLDARVLLGRDLRADRFRPSRCHARTPCSAARQTAAHRRSVVTRGSCMGTESSDVPQNLEHFARFLSRNRAFPCSNPETG